MINLLREIKDFYYFFKLSKFKKQVVFYAEYGGQYIYLEGIIKELTGKHNQDICYITSDAADPIFNSRNERISSFYINNLLAFFMPLVDCKVMVMTLTDLDNYYIKRSKNPVHYVYIFHSMVSTHMVYRSGSFDNYDSILCVGPYQIREIRKHEALNGLPPKKLVEAGYYRLEKMHLAYHNYLKNSEENKKSEKSTVLIAPSWGDDNILESCGEKIIATLLDSGYKVVVRPHMETVKHRSALLAMLEVKFSSNSGFVMKKEFSSDDLVFEADVLISDYSGAALSYAFGTERPVLFIDVPPKIKNKKFNELNIEPFELSLRSQIGTVLPVSQIDSIADFVNMLILKREDYRNKIIKTREENIYAFGRSSEIGANYIVGLL